MEKGGRFIVKEGTTEYQILSRYIHQYFSHSKRSDERLEILTNASRELSLFRKWTKRSVRTWFLNNASKFNINSEECALVSSNDGENSVIEMEESLVPQPKNIPNKIITVKKEQSVSLPQTQNQQKSNPKSTQNDKNLYHNPPDYITRQRQQLQESLLESQKKIIATQIEMQKNQEITPIRKEAMSVAQLQAQMHAQMNAQKKLKMEQNYSSDEEEQIKRHNMKSLSAMRKESLDLIKAQIKLNMQKILQLLPKNGTSLDVSSLNSISLDEILSDMNLQNDIFSDENEEIYIPQTRLQARLQAEKKAGKPSKEPQKQDQVEEEFDSSQEYIPDVDDDDDDYDDEDLMIEPEVNDINAYKRMLSRFYNATVSDLGYCKKYYSKYLNDCQYFREHDMYLSYEPENSTYNFPSRDNIVNYSNNNREIPKGDPYGEIWKTRVPNLKNIEEFDCTFIRKNVIMCVQNLADESRCLLYKCNGGEWSLLPLNTYSSAISCCGSERFAFIMFHSSIIICDLVYKTTKLVEINMEGSCIAMVSDKSAVLGLSSTPTVIFMSSDVKTEIVNLQAVGEPCGIEHIVSINESIIVVFKGSPVIFKYSNDGKLRKIMYGHTDRITHLCAFGNRFMTVSMDKTAKLWRKDNGNLILSISSEKKEITGCFLTEKYIVLCLCDNTICIFNERIREPEIGVSTSFYAPLCPFYNEESDTLSFFGKTIENENVDSEKEEDHFKTINFVYGYFQPFLYDDYY